MSVLYFIAAFVIVAVLYWVLYRVFVPRVIRDSTAKMREWTDASKKFTAQLTAYVKPGDEIEAARQKLTRMGFADFDTQREPGLYVNRYKLPLLFRLALPLATWTIETKADGARVSGVRGIASGDGA